MRLERVEAREFGGMFPKGGMKDGLHGGRHLYNSVEFTELNREKCEDVHYLLFGESRVHLGIILGERGERLISGFSAPFGGFTWNGVKSLEHVDSAVELLKEYGESQGKRVTVILPPAFYDEGLTVKTAHSLLRHGRLQWTDINYHIDLEREGDPADWLTSKARNKYRNSLESGLRMEELDARKPEDVARAYEVIRRNRQWRGYPLRMSGEEVWRTAGVADAIFGVVSAGGEDVAAVQIHRAGAGIGQVVYWGDAPGFGELRPMNFLAVETGRLARGKGLRKLDIGPSSEDGIPSYGLCEFKESVGCEAGLKMRFEL